LTRESTVGLIHSLIRAIVDITDDTGEFLLKLPDGRVIDTKGWAGWEWTHGVGLYGLLKLHEATGDKEALQIALAWFADRLPQGTSKNVNTVAPFLTAAYLHEQGHADYSAHLDEWAEWVMNDMPRTQEGGLQHMTYVDAHDGQLWCDTLVMTVLPLAKIGLVLNRPHYVEEAKRQFLVHIKYLTDVETGLWFHGWTFNGRHHFARARWARGDCWITIAIPTLISVLSLPSSSGFTQFLVTTLVSQLRALLKYQDPVSGLWHTLIDDESSYLEASASAGFAYGILLALRLDLFHTTGGDATTALSESEIQSFKAMAFRAISGIIPLISPAGELLQTSFGTPVFGQGELQKYKEIPITPMPYGQALAMLALGEYLRTLPE